MENATAVPSSKLARFLTIPTVPGDKKKSPVNSGARFLTSNKCVQTLEEKGRDACR